MRKITLLRTVTSIVAVLALSRIASGSAAASQNFVAPISGGEEVPPRDTNARGVATFQVSSDATAVDYNVNVANIVKVYAAHIHCGAEGVNGAVGVTLFSGAPAGGRINGTLAEGTITAPDPGNGCGWTDLDDVLAAIA